MEYGEDLAFRVAQLVEKLPPMPASIDGLLARPGEGATAEAGLIDLAERDSGLCADLLRFANMPFSRGEGDVETIRDAVQRVGLRPLIQLAGVSFARGAIAREFAALENVNEYFEHSQDISVSCSVLARVCSLPEHQREMYSVAGLIHDMGRLVIMLAGDRTGTSLLGTSWDEMTSIVRDENDLYGLNHCDVGMQICRKWNFSPVLQEGVLRHHTPLVDGDFSYPGALIFIAHFVSMSDFTGAILANVMRPEILERLALDAASFDTAKAIYNSPRRL